MAYSYAKQKNFGGGSGDANFTLIKVTPDTSATGSITVTELAGAANVWLVADPIFDLAAAVDADLQKIKATNVLNVITFSLLNAAGAAATVVATDTFNLLILHNS